MASTATLELDLDVMASAGGTAISYEARHRWAPGTIKRETVSLIGASTFTALSPPSGSKAVILLIPTTAASLTLKGVSGDATGIAIVPATGFIGLPIIVPLGTSPSIGILNAGATVSIEALWL